MSRRPAPQSLHRMPVRSGALAPRSPLRVGVAADGLTPTTGLPDPDLVEDVVLVHPVTGQIATLPDVPVWTNRRWTTYLNPNPGSGETWRFRNCRWDTPGESRILEVGETNARTDQMQPLVVLDDCSIDGNNTSSKALEASYVWLRRCSLRRCEDGWTGAAYSVAEDCSIEAGTDGLTDPHADAIQLSGTGRLAVYRSWLSAGTIPAARNAGLRIGTEFSAVEGIDVYFCTLDNGGYAMQMRGDAGAGDITKVRVVGCEWTRRAVYGPVDFEQASVDAWCGNRFADGVPIPRPVA